MKDSYSTPQIEVYGVSLCSPLLTSITTLSGSSGENIGNKNKYDYDWEDES